MSKKIPKRDVSKDFTCSVAHTSWLTDIFCRGFVLCALLCLSKEAVSGTVGHSHREHGLSLPEASGHEVRRVYVGSPGTTAPHHSPPGHGPSTGREWIVWGGREGDLKYLERGGEKSELAQG